MITVIFRSGPTHLPVIWPFGSSGASHVTVVVCGPVTSTATFVGALGAPSAVISTSSLLHGEAPMAFFVRMRTIHFVLGRESNDRSSAVLGSSISFLPVNAVSLDAKQHKFDTCVARRVLDLVRDRATLPRRLRRREPRQAHLHKRIPFGTNRRLSGITVPAHSWATRAARSSGAMWARRSPFGRRPRWRARPCAACCPRPVRPSIRHRAGVRMANSKPTRRRFILRFILLRSVISLDETDSAVTL